MSLTVFITGADKGLGFCLADKFSREGCRVFAGHMGDGAKLNTLAPPHPGSVTLIPQNVADMTSIKQSAAKVGGLTDSLDILINCAGINQDMETPLPDLDLTNGTLENQMTVNAFGPLRVIQTFLPLVQRGSGKKIVNISSEAGSIAENWRDIGYAYCMSKAAFNMQSAILQKYLAPQNIKVLVFHPGWMRTDMGGPTAHITPETSADGIYTLAMRAWKIDEPNYMDYTGRLYKW
jgi:NAD(P)-dependent dehydrogenase (short-subunit alcohol dehydrogenase family)